MNRRSFFTALTAPLIVRPSLEDIARLTWKRRYFPGVGPGRRIFPGPLGTTIWFADVMLEMLGDHLVFAREIERHVTGSYPVGDTITVNLRVPEPLQPMRFSVDPPEPESCFFPD